MRTKTDYIEGNTLQIDLWGDQFAALEERVAHSVHNGRANFKRKLQALARKKRALKLRLREAAHGTTAVEWEDVKDELQEAVSDFRSLATEVYDDVRKA
ncbi:MAG: hypothetical protein ACI82F_001225 [Planctomycetota bacterium]|jgi:hypothetical protein